MGHPSALVLLTIINIIVAIIGLAWLVAGQMGWFNADKLMSLVGGGVLLVMSVGTELFQRLFLTGDRN